MQVFELHFNASAKKQDAVFDSFCYEPENIYEKKIGALYLVGALLNVLPRNIRLLDNLATFVKESYYRPKSIELMVPEKALKQSMEKTNEYLGKIGKSGDVSWLGNLSFAVLSVVPFQGKYIFNLAKVGDLKILVLRDKQIIDIEQKLILEDIEPYPLKIFNNIVSGELIENDLLLILTKGIFEEFSTSFPNDTDQSLLDKIADITIFEEDKLLKILKINFPTKISGVCLLIALSQQALPGKKISIKPNSREFSFTLLNLLRRYSKNIWHSFQQRHRFPNPFMGVPNPFGKRIWKRIWKTSFPNPFVVWKTKIINLRAIKISESTKQKIILIFALIWFLVLGFFIF
ncbi:MAG: hypothetical protein KYQ20_02115 [Candidatus Nealsonbacteria bacterium]|nr:hypothetical protein [Candidatus Nealsonbacteria bacterium]